jgi:hydrocephalus-inducing protein
VREPNVFIDTGKVNFGPLLLSGKAKECVRIKNLENVPIQFHFDKESLKGESDVECITVHPMSGVIRANSDCIIDITFAPKEERSFNFNILCYMKRKARPISLNIKGIGYQMHQTVQLD